MSADNDAFVSGASSANNSSIDPSNIDSTKISQDSKVFSIEVINRAADSIKSLLNNDYSYEKQNEAINQIEIDSLKELANSIFVWKSVVNEEYFRHSIDQSYKADNFPFHSNEKADFQVSKNSDEFSLEEGSSHQKINEYQLNVAIFIIDQTLSKIDGNFVDFNSDSIEKLNQIGQRLRNYANNIELEAEKLRNHISDILSQSYQINQDEKIDYFENQIKSLLDNQLNSADNQIINQDQTNNDDTLLNLSVIKEKILNLDQILCSVDNIEFNNDQNIDERLDFIIKRVGMLKNNEKTDIDTLASQWTEICNEGLSIDNSEDRAQFFMERFSEAEVNLISNEKQRSKLIEILSSSKSNDKEERLINTIKEQNIKSENLFTTNRNLNNDLSKLKRTLLQMKIEMREKDDQIKASKQRFVAIKTALTKTKLQLNEASKELAELKSISDVQAEDNADMLDKIITQANEICELTKKVDAAQNIISNQTVKLNAQQKTIAENKEQLNINEKEISELIRKSNGLVRQKARSEERVSKLEKQLTEARQKSRFRFGIKDVNSITNSITNEFNALIIKTGEQENEIDNLKYIKEGLEDELEMLKTALNDMAQQAQAKSVLCSEYEDKLLNQKLEIDSKSKELDELLKKCDPLEKEAIHLRASEQNHMNEIRILEQKLQAITKINEENEGKIDELEQKVNVKDAENIAKDEKISQLEEKYNKQENAIKRMKNNGSFVESREVNIDTEEENTYLKKQIEALSQESESKDLQIIELERKMQKIQKGRNRGTRLYKQRPRSFMAICERVNGLKCSESLNSGISLLSQANINSQQTEESKLIDFEGEKENLNREIQEKSQKISELMQQNQEKDDEIAKLEDHIEELLLNQNEQEKEINDLKVQLADYSGQFTQEESGIIELKLPSEDEVNIELVNNLKQILEQTKILNEEKEEKIHALNQAIMENKKKNKKIIDEKTQEIQNYTEKIEILQNENQEKENMLMSLENEINENKSQLANYEQNIAELNYDIEEYKQEKANLNELNIQNEDIINKLNEKIQKLKNDFIEMKNEYDEKNKENISIKDELNSLKEENLRITTNNNNSLIKEQNMIDQINLFKNEIDSQKIILEKLRYSNAFLRRADEDKAKANIKLTQEIKDMKSILNKKDTEINELKAQIEKLGETNQENSDVISNLIVNLNNEKLKTEKFKRQIDKQELELTNAKLQIDLLKEVEKDSLNNEEYLILKNDNENKAKKIFKLEQQINNLSQQLEESKQNNLHSQTTLYDNLINDKMELEKKIKLLKEENENKLNQLQNTNDKYATTIETINKDLDKKSDRIIELENFINELLKQESRGFKIRCMLDSSNTGKNHSKLHSLDYLQSHWRDKLELLKIELKQFNDVIVKREKFINGKLYNLRHDVIFETNDSIHLTDEILELESQTIKSKADLTESNEDNMKKDNETDVEIDMSESKQPNENEQVNKNEHNNKNEADLSLIKIPKESVLEEFDLHGSIDKSIDNNEVNNSKTHIKKTLSDNSIDYSNITISDSDDITESFQDLSELESILRRKGKLTSQNATSEEIIILKQNVDDFQKMNQSLQENVSRLNDQLAEKEEEIQKLNSEIQEKSDNVAYSSLKEKDNENGKLKLTISNLEKELEASKKQIVSKEKEIDDYRNLNESLMKSDQTIRRLSDVLENNEKNESQRRIIQLENELIGLGKKNEILLRENFQYKEKLQALEGDDYFEGEVIERDIEFDFNEEEGENDSSDNNNSKKTRRHNLMQKLKIQEHKIKELSTLIQNDESILSSKTSQIKSLEQQLKEEKEDNAEKVQSLEQTINQLTTELNNLRLAINGDNPPQESMINVTDRDIQLTDEDIINQIKNENENESKNKTSNEENFAKNNREIESQMDRLQKENLKLQDTINELNQTIRNTNTKNNEITTMTEELKKENEQLITQINKLNLSINDQNNVREKLISDQKSLETQNNELETNLNESKEQINQLEQKITKLLKEKESSLSNLTFEELSQENTNLKSQINELSSQIQNSKQMEDEIQKHITQLEELKQQNEELKQLNNDLTTKWNDSKMNGKEAGFEATSNDLVSEKSDKENDERTPARSIPSINSNISVNSIDSVNSLSQLNDSDTFISNFHLSNEQLKNKILELEQAHAKDSTRIKQLGIALRNCQRTLENKVEEMAKAFGMKKEDILSNTNAYKDNIKKIRTALSKYSKIVKILGPEDIILKVEQLSQEGKENSHNLDMNKLKHTAVIMKRKLKNYKDDNDKVYSLLNSFGTDVIEDLSTDLSVYDNVSIFLSKFPLIMADRFCNQIYEQIIAMIDQKLCDLRNKVFYLIRQVSKIIASDQYRNKAYLLLSLPEQDEIRESLRCYNYVMTALFPPSYNMDQSTKHRDVARNMNKLKVLVQSILQMIPKPILPKQNNIYSYVLAINRLLSSSSDNANALDVSKDYSASDMIFSKGASNGRLFENERKIELLKEQLEQSIPYDTLCQTLGDILGVEPMEVDESAVDDMLSAIKEKMNLYEDIDEEFTKYKNSTMNFIAMIKEIPEEAKELAAQLQVK
ncbi:hypothetical protein TRFO_17786 [Tritrichomonas foetus]|uniref:Uncharacterized protein n=1 Tax=Tritrichomonas foetus TaxID=1144522 RepID=A0A1J4KM65_9EUKA|nr:hypothetical protein TRFO_17786 [Tritrichomonas foetus]|eukprot:OHT12407.1 hypothetical protein TRFO_17786 [Tritrichomonas foetus]